ncbi:hypothetical protein ACFPRL_14060 [Pseudoclavibacter helvolus]
MHVLRLRARWRLRSRLVCRLRRAARWVLDCLDLARRYTHRLCAVGRRADPGHRCRGLGPGPAAGP